MPQKQAEQLARSIRAAYLEDVRLRRGTPLCRLVEAELDATGLDYAPCSGTCGTTGREIAREIRKIVK